MSDRIMRRLSLVLLALLILLVACEGDAAVPEEITTPVEVEMAAPPATATAEPAPQPTAEPAAVVTSAAELLALEGDAAYYVARLPRPSDVPAGWRMDRTPQFTERSPAPGETYRFACEDLPARSTGLATVGYRNLDALPSITIEYVVYPTAGDAAAALDEMRSAVAACPEFALSGDPESDPDATFSALELPSFGNDSFGAALATNTGATGDLLTHVVKIQRDNVVVGVNHANWADQSPPDAAITTRIVELTLDYLGR